MKVEELLPLRKRNLVADPNRHESCGSPTAFGKYAPH
jgi:hypothetical protein